LQWVGSNYKYPQAARDAKVSGRVIVQFVVEKDGHLSDIKAVRDLGYGTGEAAVALLATSKLWKPGIQNGKPVRVQYTLPLMLKVSKNLSTDTTTKKSVFSDNPNTPLFIVDGKEVTAEEAKLIKPADIKSMEVFKDKDALAKYGEKGKNGVIIITMKPKE
ncbi:MAG: TonB family protein, partial [Sphingobacteriaceae bacterium]